MIPVEDADAIAQLEEVIQLNLDDDTHSWALEPDGVWSRIPTVIGISAQRSLELAALERGSLLDELR